ncbi:MAG: PAS domain S-box protein [Bacteroidales bacterium]|nr:PAS domain S-box protein [Bacteroidales bacterium]
MKENDISKIQAELAETTRMLKTLISNLSGMVYRCRSDHNWTMEYISEGCFEITGYHPEDLIDNKKLSFNDLIHPEDKERIWTEVQSKLEEEKPFTLFYRIIGADKKVKWVKEQGVGLRNPTRDAIILEGFITDDTSENHNRLLRDVIFEISKSSYETESLDDLLAIVHHQLGKIIDTTNFFVALYHKETDSITLPYHVDFKDKFASFPAGKTMTGHVIQTKKPILASEKEIYKLVEEGVIDIVGTPSKIWLGVPLTVEQAVIGAIVVQNYSDPNCFDKSDLSLLSFVADQVAGLIMRKKTEDNLRKESAYLDQLYQSSSEAILMIDNNGVVKSINKEFSLLFGYTESEILGKNIDEMIVPRYLSDEGVRNTNRALTNERVEMESVRQHKNGMLIDVSLLVTPIFIEGAIVGAYGIYRDITDRKRIEKSLIIAKEKAEESDRLKSAFLSNMSHEIRTPMNAILGFSGLLSDPGATEEEKAEYINIIKERGNDLMRIISDIIDVAKIESGQLKINIKDCKVNRLMDDILVVFNQLKQKQEKHDVELKTSLQIPDPEFTILTDPQRLRQVITNLLENSLKFTESGAIEFGYTIKEDFGIGKSIEFFIQDSGIGIPKEMQSVIFERFRQVDDSHTRKYGGTGLGLTICKNLTHLMGGELRLQSEVGKGTKFTITLPMWTITSTKEEPVTETQKAKPNTWTDKVILIAEDEESNYTFLEHVLKRTGVKLIWAQNGKDAVNIAQTEKIDLILMDIRMPGMDGYEATEIIKKENKSLPIIAQTAYALKGEKELSIGSGCDDYISKPIDITELMGLLSKHLK